MSAHHYLQLHQSGSLVWSEDGKSLRVATPLLHVAERTDKEMLLGDSRNREMLPAAETL